MKKSKIIFIVGPTASGKSDLSIKIASKYNLPIINCDSKLLYKRFDIGTAKPSKIDQSNVKHFMVDVLKDTERSNLRWFLDESRKIISNLSDSNVVPIVTGGTGQYIWGLLEGWDPPKIEPNKKLRNKIEDEIKKFGIQEIIKRYSKIYELDGHLDLENPIRLIRIIERYEAGFKGEPTGRLKNHDIDFLILGINVDRKKSDELIRKRIKIMLEMGWIEEVKDLLNDGINPKSPPMFSIGYREILEFLNRELDQKQLEEKIYFSTRKLLRHQDNWFKKTDKRIKWINFENSFKEADIIISEWLTK